MLHYVLYGQVRFFYILPWCFTSTETIRLFRDVVAVHLNNLCLNKQIPSLAFWHLSSRKGVVNQCMELDVCIASYGKRPAGTMQEPKIVCPLGVQVQRERLCSFKVLRHSSSTERSWGEVGVGGVGWGV